MVIVGRRLSMLFLLSWVFLQGFPEGFYLDILSEEKR